MKKYIVIACCLLTTYSLHGQKKWTFRECVDFAIENNIDIRQQDLQVKGAEIDLSTSKNSRLPNLNGRVGQDFSFGRSQSMATGIYEDNKAASTSFSVSTGLPVFTGFRIPNQVKSDEMALRSAMEGLEKAKENLELEIASFFLDILFKQEILKVYQEQVALTEKQVTRTAILVESGKVATSQLYDIRAQLAKDQLNVTTAKNDLELSLLNLAQLLNLRSFDDFNIEAPRIEDEFISNDVLMAIPDEIYQRATKIKPHVKEAIYKVEGSKYDLKVAQSGYWPTIDLGVSYTNGFSHIYKDDYDNISVSEQLKNNYRALIGFSMNIPIFNRFETRNRVRKARLNINSQELNLVNVKLNLYKEIQQAHQNAMAAEAKYYSTEKAYEAAAESFRYAEERYQIGKATVFEYNEAQTKMINSRSEQIQSKYDYLFRNKILDFYAGKQIDI